MAKQTPAGLVFRSAPALDAWAVRRRVLPLVLLMALAVRVTHLLAFRDSPFFAALTLGARCYDDWAQRLAAGGWVGSHAFWVDPLYAHALGALYADFVLAVGRPGDQR